VISCQYLIENGFISFLIQYIEESQNLPVQSKFPLIILARLTSCPDAIEFKSDFKLLIVNELKQESECDVIAVATILVFIGRHSAFSDSDFASQIFIQKFLSFVNNHLREVEFMKLALEFVRIRSQYSMEAVAFLDCGLLEVLNNVEHGVLRAKYSLLKVMVISAPEAVDSLMTCDGFKQELIWVMHDGTFEDKECAVELLEAMIGVNWRVIEDGFLFEMICEICELIASSCGAVFVNGLVILYEVLEIEQKIGSFRLRDYLLGNGFSEILDRVVTEIECDTVRDLMKFLACSENFGEG
jgi:hypothetical protein